VELIAILRMLWCRRGLVAVGAIAAIAFALIALRGLAPGPLKLSRQQTVVGLASMRVLVDTEDSELVYTSPEAADIVGEKAAMIADLMATDPLKRMIAANAGLRADQLTVLGPSSMSEPSVPTWLSDRAAPVGMEQRGSYALIARADGQLPIITIETRAPDARRAQVLASAAASALKTWAPPNNLGQMPGFVVRALAPPRSSEMVVATGRRLFAIIAAGGLFGAWCVSILIGAGIARWASQLTPRRRATSP
jgi:hypothetical protein